MGRWGGFVGRWGGFVGVPPPSPKGTCANNLYFVFFFDSPSCHAMSSSVRPQKTKRHLCQQYNLSSCHVILCPSSKNQKGTCTNNLFFLFLFLEFVFLFFDLSSSANNLFLFCFCLFFYFLIWHHAMAIMPSSVRPQKTKTEGTPVRR